MTAWRATADEPFAAGTRSTAGETAATAGETAATAGETAATAGETAPGAGETAAAAGESAAAAAAGETAATAGETARMTQTETTATTEPLLRAVEIALLTGSDNELLALSGALDAHLAAHLADPPVGGTDRTRAARRAEHLRFVLRTMGL